MLGYAVVDPEVTGQRSAPNGPLPASSRVPLGRKSVPVPPAPTPEPEPPVVTLNRGDVVVFTGQMRVPREIWERRAVAAGLVPYPGVTPRVRLVVAGDPAALSGKARTALELGIPVITEEEFGRLIAQRRR